MAESNEQLIAEYEAKRQQSLAIEAEKREMANAILSAIYESSKAATPDTSGKPWTQPTGAHNAIAKGSRVIHNGKLWESLIPFNVYQPGVSGWREVAQNNIPEWIQPTGSVDAYNAGDKVRFRGKTYMSKMNGNSWSPAVYPQSWQLIPEPAATNKPQSDPGGRK